MFSKLSILADRLSKIDNIDDIKPINNEIYKLTDEFPKFDSDKSYINSVEAVISRNENLESDKKILLIIMVEFIGDLMIKSLIEDGISSIEKISRIRELNSLIIYRCNKLVFYYDDIWQVKAAGIILYSITNDFSYLMILKNGRYEDFGGKISTNDNDYYDTAIREASEESNNLINITRERLFLSKHYYIKKSKYVLFFVEATNEEKKINLSNFIENVRWININNDTNLHLRLENKLFDKLKKKK